MNLLALSQPPQLKTAQRNSRTIVLFGDSIVANGLGMTSGGYATFSCRGPFNVFQILARQPFLILANKGIGGNTTTQMLARIQTDVLSYNPGWVYMNGGTNDLGADTAANIIGRLQTMFQILRSNGINVIMQTILPRSDAGFTYAMQQKLYTVNWWLRDYCTKTDGMYLADLYDTLLDHSSTVNAEGCVPNPAYVSADNIHPNATGGWAMGQALYDQLSGVIPFGSTFLGNGSRYSSSTGDQTVLNRNSKMILGTKATLGAGASGDFCQHYWCNRTAGSGITAVGSVIGRPSAPAFFSGSPIGSVQKISLANAASASDEMGVNTLLDILPAVGAKCVIETEIYAKATSGTLGVIHTWAFMDSDGVGTNVFSVDQLNDAPVGRTEFAGVLRTPIFSWPAGNIAYPNAYMYLHMRTSAGAAVDVYLGNQCARIINL